MSKAKKKKIRAAFREAVFARDKYTCLGCGFVSSSENVEKELQAHHIVPRKDFCEEGEYLLNNGISLCATCHEKAESIYSYGIPIDGFCPGQLLVKIGSSFDQLKWYRND